MKHTATTKPQLATGPQKWVVLGPTGLFKNALNDEAICSDCLLNTSVTVATKVRLSNRRGRHVNQMWFSLQEPWGQPSIESLHKNLLERVKQSLNAFSEKKEASQ